MNLEYDYMLIEPELNFLINNTHTIILPFITITIKSANHQKYNEYNPQRP